MNYQYERDYSQEECFHSECADSRWLRYCPIEAVDEDGDLGEVVDRLNDVLYSVDIHEQRGARYDGQGDQRIVSRSYERDYLPDSELSRRPYRIHTSIQHSRLVHPSRDVYWVVAQWYMVGEDTLSQSYRTEYCIEQFEGAPAIATITERDLQVAQFDTPADDEVVSRFVDRPMTGYDHQQLHRLLLDISSFQTAE